MRKRLFFEVAVLSVMLALWGVRAHAQDVSAESNTSSAVTAPSAGGAGAPTAPAPQGTGGTAYDQSDLKDSKLDVFAGYSFLDNGFGTRVGNHGWNLEGAWNLNHNLGFSADFSGHSSSNSPGINLDQDQDFYSYLFGPKLTHHSGKVQMYTHFLVGVSHGHFSQRFGSGVPFGFQGNGFSLAGGGGVDYLVRQNWGWRMLEADYIFSDLSNGSSIPAQNFNATVHNVRISTGLIFRWGER